MVKKTPEGYKVTPKITKLKLQPTHNEAPSAQLLQTFLPSDLRTQQLLLELKGKWFGLLRWLGMSENSEGVTLKWITEDGGIQVNANIVAPNIASDAGLTDQTVCWKNTATTGTFLKGSGALGICLGTSGKQFKTDFAPMKVGINELMKINFVNYRYRQGIVDSGERMQYGPTAQNVEAAIPDLARHDANGETINYDYGALLFVGLHAIQQLKADNDNIELRLEKLERRIAR
jgi:hypothetical protein